MARIACATLHPADQQFGVAEFAQTTDMVPMQVRQDDRAHIAHAVADAFQQDARGLIRSTQRGSRIRVADYCASLLADLLSSHYFG